jgi:hypothetical protein
MAAQNGEIKGRVEANLCKALERLGKLKTQIICQIWETEVTGDYEWSSFSHVIVWKSSEVN